MPFPETRKIKELYFYLFFLGTLILLSSCSVEHALSGDAYIHVLQEQGCLLSETEGGLVFVCPGKTFACLPTETPDSFLCQLVSE